MPNQQIMSLAIGRAAGKSAGVSPQNLGRLSIVSYMLANPVLAMVAARSMAPKGDVNLIPDDTGKQDPASTAEDVKAAVDAAKVAAAAAGASEANAKASAGAAKASADAAKASADRAEAVIGKAGRG